MKTILRKKVAIAIAAIGVIGVIGVSLWQERSPATYYVVHAGKQESVIVRQSVHSATWNEAVREFQDDIRRATGVMLPIVEVDELNTVPEGYTKILIGPGPLTESLGIVSESLPSESYRIAAYGNHFVLTGSDPDAVVSAVSYFLDKYMGVRWLWPGELGTYVPKRETIAVPAIDITERPALERRILRTAKQSPPEAEQWKRRHMLGDRSALMTGHSFTKWWDKYAKDRPDYFAVPPDGYPQMPPDRVKLDIGNTAVDEAIIREWKEAGSPDFWNVSPNDGTGFCISELCLAMDTPVGQPIYKIWKGEANLTARYVRFWNRLLEKMRPLNPKLILSSYAYSAYREPPPDGVKLHDGMVLGFVHSTRADAKAAWKGWSDAGAQLLLRPNWWHTGAVAPYLSMHDTGEYFIYARDRNMYGFDFDTLLGYWGTQGPNYYTIARLSARPDLSVDDVIAEYASAFGDAAPVIAEYISYWEQFGKEANYVQPGDELLPETERQDGLYTSIVKQNGLSKYPIIASWQVIPYLYTDEVLDKARGILDRAAQTATGGDEYVNERIDFLKDGLRHLELTREVIRYGFEKTRPAEATEADFLLLSNQLAQLRVQQSARHVIWGKVLDDVEQRRNIPTALSRTQGWTKNMADNAKPDEEYIGM